MKNLWGKLAAIGVIVGAVLVIWAAWPAGAEHGLIGKQMPWPF